MIPSTSLDRCRNIGILASPDAGRTTTTERMLMSARPVADAAPQLSLPGLEEIDDRGITLTAAAISCDWRDARINIVELAAAETASLDALTSVLDGLVLVVDGSNPAELAPGALAASSAARIAFVNKLDLFAGQDPAAAFKIAIDRLDTGLGAVPVAVQLPYGANLTGVADLIAMEAVEWDASRFDSPAVRTTIPAEHLAAAEQARTALLAALDQDATSPAQIVRQALRIAVLEGRVMPVLCGSAFLSRGIDSLLDAIVDYLPAPSELENLRGRTADGNTVERRPSAQEPFTGVAFGTVEDPAQGKLTFVRIFSGVVATGGTLLNTASANPERIGRMVRMHANRAEEIGEARAGDIVAVAGLQHTTTGDTLCDPANPLVVEHFPLKRVPAAAGRAQH